MRPTFDLEVTHGGFLYTFLMLSGQSRYWNCFSIPLCFFILFSSTRVSLFVDDLRHATMCLFFFQQRKNSGILQLSEKGVPKYWLSPCLFRSCFIVVWASKAYQSGFWKDTKKYGTFPTNGAISMGCFGSKFPSTFGVEQIQKHLPVVNRRRGKTIDPF